MEWTARRDLMHQGAREHACVLTCGFCYANIYVCHSPTVMLLVVTSATLLVTGALLVVTKKLLVTSATHLPS